MNHKTPAEERLAAATAREQLEAEIAALRELLAAASAAASLPLAAPGNGMKRREAAVLRADYIAEFCRMDEAAVSGAGILRARAKVLRDVAASPLPYEPEPVTIAGDYGPEQVDQ